MKPRVLILSLVTALAGCMGGNDSSATQAEEEMFRNPKAVDPSKIPPGGFKRNGPEFIGEPSGATNPSGSKPPPGVVNGG